jgi:hypothetical protein
MRYTLTAGIASLVVIAASVFLPAVFSTPIAAQAARFHVLTVPSGGVTCANMIGNLRTDGNSWGVFYSTYVAGFITAANFVTYADSGRNPNVDPRCRPMCCPRQSSGIANTTLRRTSAKRWHRFTLTTSRVDQRWLCATNRSVTE